MPLELRLRMRARRGMSLRRNVPRFPTRGVGTQEARKAAPAPRGGRAFGRRASAGRPRLSLKGLKAAGAQTARTCATETGALWR